MWLLKQLEADAVPTTEGISPKPPESGISKEENLPVHLMLPEQVVQNSTQRKAQVRNASTAP